MKTFIEKEIAKVIPATELTRIKDIKQVIFQNKQWLKDLSNKLNLKCYIDINEFDKDYNVLFDTLSNKKKKIITKNKMLFCIEKTKDIKHIKEINRKSIIAISSFDIFGIENFNADDFILITDEILSFYKQDLNNIKKQYTTEEANEYIDTILQQALDLKISDIFITGVNNKYEISFQKDEYTQTIDEKSIEFVNICINVLKYRCNITATEDVAKLDGKFTYIYKGKEVQFRFSLLKLANSLFRIALRSGAMESSIMKLEELNIYPPVIDILRECGYRNAGLTIIAGKTGSGKTETLYALLLEIKQTTNQIIMTLENPVERNYDGLLVQIPIDGKYLTYALATEAALRQKPSKLLVGEIRNTEDGKASLEVALTGHGSFTTLHTDNIFAFRNRIKGLNLKEDEVASVISGVIFQNMGITLCPKCKIKKGNYYIANLSKDNNCKYCSLKSNKYLNNLKTKGYTGKIPCVSAVLYKNNALDLSEKYFKKYITYEESLKWQLENGFIDKLIYFNRKIELSIPLKDEEVKELEKLKYKYLKELKNDD